MKKTNPYRIGLIILFYLYIILSILILIVIYLKKLYKNIKIYPFLLCMIILPFLIHPIYVSILSSLEHFKLDNIYFIFIMFALFLFITFYLSFKVSYKNAHPK